VPTESIAAQRPAAAPREIARAVQRRILRLEEASARSGEIELGIGSILFK
jgi:hypothetical protein